MTPSPNDSGSRRTLDTAVFAGHSELATLMRGFAWAATPLGPPEGWSQGLRAVVRIVLTSRYAMWMSWGAERTCLYNDAYAAMTLGAKHPWALGRPSEEVWAEIWPQIGPRIDSVIATGEATWDERLLLFLERSGYPEETYHTFSYSPVADDDSVVRGHLCVVTEETERVIDERRLAVLNELGARLATAQTEADVVAGAESASDVAPADLPCLLIYLFGATGSAVRLASQHGVPTEVAAAVRQSLDDVVSGWAAAKSAGVLTAHERPALDVTWPARPWQIASDTLFVHPLQQPGQAEVAGVLITGVNPHRRIDDKWRSFVTLFAAQLSAGLANVRAAEEDRRRARALAELDHAKTVFFSNISHEFRTPLTLMLGPTEDALQAAEPALHGDDLRMVHRNQIRLLKLVNTLLDFSRLEAGRMTATLEAVDLAQLTADLAASFRSAIERGGLTLEVECPPLDQPVAVDPGLWEKVVLNLLSNAFKFTLSGTIRVTLVQEHDCAVLRVADSGVGIAAAHLPHVFDRFHRVEGTRARTHEGSGIGLALVQDLVTLHAGTIAVASTLGQGTTFTVSLPLGVSPAAAESALASGVTGTRHGNAYAAEAERWLSDDPALVGSSAPRGADRDPGRPLVLIADDNADMRDYAARLLRPHWRVRLVYDGEAAMAAVRDEIPALVLTDVMMPGLDGFGVLAALRADPATAHVPVIMLSARAGAEAQAGALEAGADDYLVKPFSARELVARVATHLEHARVRRQAIAERDRFFGLLRDVPAVVNYFAGPDLVFEFAHPRTSEALGDRQLLGKPLLEAVPEHRDQPFASELLEVFRTGRIHSGRSARADVAGASSSERVESHWDYTYLPVRGPDGAIQGVMTFDLEVTEQVRTQQRLEQATRAKDEFLAMLGHELRNPLAPIMTAAHLIRMKRVPEVERERTIIERQTAHLVRLVDDLLDVSRIARGKFELKRETIEMAVIVAQAIEQASPLLESRAQRLDVDVAATGLLVHVDPSRIAQALSNLLTNAAKYSEPHSSISLTAALVDGHVTMAVSDRGIGIEPDMLPMVFDMFVQEGQALDRSLGGLGLGLTIVRNIMSLHGGTASATSGGRGQGAVFTLSVPAVAGMPAGGVESKATTANLISSSGRGLTVLIVDDNDDAAKSLADVLHAHGYHVLTAPDGPSALEAIAAATPDIGVLDIGLPGMDGYELAARLRQEPNLTALCLIAVTGYGQRASVEKASAASFAAHFVKPVDPLRLIETLDQLIDVAGRRRR